MPGSHVERPPAQPHSPRLAPPPLRLLLSVRAHTPWPGLLLDVQALLPSGKRVPMDELRPVENLFQHGTQFLRPDTLDALLLRTLRNQPRGAEGAVIVAAASFARVLSLLRQVSPDCEVVEDARVARVEILDDAPRATLNLAPIEGGEALHDGSFLLRARPSFRDAETGRALGWPVARDGSYWTFENVITAPAPTCADPLLRGLFERDTGDAADFAEIEALDVLGRAHNSARELAVQLHPNLRTSAICFEPLSERARVRLDDDGNLHASAEFRAKDGTVVPLSAAFGAQAGGWIQHGGKRYRLPETLHAVNALGLLSARCTSRTVSDDEIPAFISETLPTLSTATVTIDPGVAELKVCPALRPALDIEADGETGERARASFHFEPAAPFRTGAQTEVPASKVSISPLEILAAAAQGKKFLRHGDAFYPVDREMVSQCRTRLEAGGGLGYGEKELSGEEIPKLLAWARQAERDNHTPWNCYTAESVEGAHRLVDEKASVRVSLDVEEEDGKDAWFSLQAEFDHGGVRITEDEMRKMIEEGREWFNRDGQWIHVDRDALKKFDTSLEEVGAQRVVDEDLPLFGHARKRRKKFYYRFTPAVRERLTQVFSIAGSVAHNERYRLFLEQLNGFESITPLPLPRSLKLMPRPYQQRGFEWLSFLARYGLNGVLADDMGLGKTAQTIAQLTRMKEEFGFMPSLIVTPTSLADNWRNEIQKFSPTLRVLIYRGSPTRRDRLREEISPEPNAIGAPSVEPGHFGKGYDIVIATLGTVRNDVSLLRQFPWRYVVVDEAHFIKNAAAGVAKAVKTIPAKHRLALTGTPLQNRPTEVWSLFDFLMPGFLGRESHFVKQYEEPILKMQSGRAESEDEFKTGKNAVERLREKIFPFVLRRLKTDVAKDLPPKIETDIFCSLTPEQTALYRSFGDSEEARRAVGDIGATVDGSSPAILAALMGLRKICNHPDLLCLPKDGKRQHIKEPQPGYEKRSGKLEALDELLAQCREGGHRALIFCQLTSMMDLLSHFLNARGMKHLRIDGETPGTSRQALVERFNGDTNLQAFLISTRAGGAGLNLTGADTVIFYDHDWNPANDQQAQDRAYRIGQKRTVNVYRLICKGTLEEKILRRQALKKALSASIVTHDIAGVKNLTKDALLDLFTLSEAPEAGA